MQYLLISLNTLIGLFLILEIRRSFSKKLSLSFSQLHRLTRLYEDLKEEKKRRINKREFLNKDLEQEISLFEITKEISQADTIESAFRMFKTIAEKYIKFSELVFVDEKIKLKDYKDYIIFSISVKEEFLGYLAVRGLFPESSERFNILANQFAIAIERIYLYEKIQKMAITDTLTRIFSRRYTLERYEEEFQRSKKENLSLSILMADIDNFKKYNDTFGHLVGDTILKETAQLIKLNLREIDLVGRFGGEEFLVVMPFTSKEGAAMAAERIRKALEGKTIKAYDEKLQVKISIGVATYPEDANDPQELIDKADWALYRAKKTGKNKVVVFGVYI